MNIFILDEDFDKNAEYHIDRHVTKMPLEAAQLLTTSVWVDKFLGHVPRALDKLELGVINTEKAKQPPIEERSFTRYLPTHPNHPCAIWARTSMDNYEWLFNYMIAISDEYTYRYGKTHAAMTEANKLPIPNLPYIGLTEFPQCMPYEYKRDNIVEAYRTYYMMDKASIASWKHREKPSWWEI